MQGAFKKFLKYYNCNNNIYHAFIGNTLYRLRANKNLTSNGNKPFFLQIASFSFMDAF